MNEYRFWANRTEPVKTARLELAQTYRMLRADRPVMARLLFKRMRAAEQAVLARYAAEWFESSTSAPSGGLAGLLH